MNIDELLASLRADHELAADREEEARIEKLMIAARIQGIEETREALSSTPKARAGSTNGPMTVAGRRPRRDIRAMVKAELAQSVTPVSRANAQLLAETLGCRKSQVEAALIALADEDEAAAAQAEAMDRLRLGDIVAQ